MKIIQIRRSDPFGPIFEAFCDEYGRTYNEDWYFGYWYSTPVLGYHEKHSLFDLYWETTPNDVKDANYPEMCLKDGDIIYIVSPEHLKTYYEGRAKYGDAKPVKVANPARPNTPKQKEMRANQGSYPNYATNQSQSNNRRQKNTSSQTQPNNLRAGNSDHQSQSNNLRQRNTSHQSQLNDLRGGYQDYHSQWVDALTENASLQAKLSKYRGENTRLRQELNELRPSIVQSVQPTARSLGHSSIPSRSRLASVDHGAYGPSDPCDKITEADRALLSKKS